MSPEALLQFARGTGFDIALAIFVAGILIRLIEILTLGRKSDLSEHRGSGVVGAIRTIITRNFPRSSVFAKEPIRILNGYVMHIGLFLVIFLYGPHIEFFESSFGISWPHLPSGMIDAATAITILSLAVALIYRLNVKTLRFLSTFGDYWAWLVTTLPMITGYLAYNHLLLPYTLMLALHILAVELLLISIPFSKLTHMFTFVISRWYQGFQAGQRGIES